MKVKEQKGLSINSTASNEEDLITLMDIILILARQFKVIIITPTIFCTLAIIYVLLFLKPVYTSTSKIMSSSTGGGSMSQASGLAAQFGINIPESNSETKWVYPEIIKSRTLSRSMLKRKFDTIEFGRQKTLLDILTNDLKSSNNDLTTLEVLAVDKFLGMLDVNEDIKTSIVSLSVSASEPLFALEINKTLIEELDTHQRKYNKTKTGDTKRFIKERIIDTEKELIAAEENLKIFRDRNRRIENSPALQLEQQRFEREVAVLTSVFTTLKQQFETTKIEEVKETDYVVILDSPNLPIFSSSSKRDIVIACGFIGILLGVIFGFLIDYVNKSPKKEKEKLALARSIIINYFKKVLPKRYLY
ncbi:MAG: hypothetical protein CMG60_07105 [Candidatus Marinimicrobia bacterium]|nr:hypothetical protein [Candidatus Neomarinimicrobiota bacterium]